MRNTNLIPSDSLLPLVEARVDHSLKQSLEIQNVKNIQTEPPLFFVILPLARRQLDIQLIERPTRGMRSEMGSETEGIRFVYCKKWTC